MKWLALILALLFAAPASASPTLNLAARRGRITVLAEKGLESLGAELADGAEKELKAIADDLGDLPRVEGVEVRLVNDAKDLAAIAPGGRGAPEYAIGVAYPDLGVIGLAVRRGSTISDPAATLRHELAHVALGAAIGDRAPHWLHEGFAYQHSQEWSWDRTETLSGMAWFGGIIPLNQLDRSFPAEEAPANRAYAESYDFVGFLSRRGRYDDGSDRGDRFPFRHFLAEVGHGRSLDDAAKKAFGRPIGALFDEWREDLTTRYLTAPLGLLGLAVWVLCAVLLVLGFWRRKRQQRRRYAEWDREDAERQAMMMAEPPPDAPPPDEPRLMN